MFNHLFKPIKIGHTTLPNRICFLGHRTNFAIRGRLTDRHVTYYARRAQGECGLIIVGELSIHPDDRPWESMIEAYHPDAVNDFHKLTKAVHKHGTAIFVQLNHHGFQSSGAITRKGIWGPSAVSDIVFGETAKSMEPEDFEILLDSFAGAARKARDGGFDGLEIDMGPESLLRQFLSPLSNHRQDEYGGILENRMRLPLQVLQRVRETVGADFTVGIQLCADEKFWGAITPDESRQFAERFASDGRADFINVSVGTYYNLYLVLPSMHTPLGFTVDVAKQIKETVNIPVMASYQINSPKMAEEILEKGRADLIGFVRPLICDPDFPHKAQQGRQKDIRYCVRDNKGCIGRINQSKALSCTQNPSVGYEDPDGDESFIMASAKKKVIIIGGGPGGLEAARVAKIRGHEVTLYEKDHVPGGQVNLIKKLPGRQPMAGIIHHLIHALYKLEVPVITRIEVTSDLILEKNPDTVIVATGSRPRKKPVTGVYDSPWVLNVWEALDGSYPVGQKVLFIDENGGHHATGTIELLADQGKNVTMVTSDLFVGIELAPLGDLYLTRQRLLQRGVIFISDVMIDLISGYKVIGRDLYTNKTMIFDDYDTVILDMGNVPVDDLYFQLKEKVKELYRVGDCVAPRGVDMAILEGREAGDKP